jgi:hypothetical protein
MSIRALSIKVRPLQAFYVPLNACGLKSHGPSGQRRERYNGDRRQACVDQ